MPDQTTKVSIADDHPAFRVGLKTIIGQDSAFEVLAEAGDGESAVRLIEEHEPDIAVVDWGMPKLNGLQVAREVKRRRLRTRIILLTMHKEESLFNEAMDGGVSGFVVKDNAVDDILDSLHSVGRGDVYLSPIVANYLLKRNRRIAALREEKPGLEELTPTEKKVIKLVAGDRTTKEIAGDLGVSPRTIETHRRNICQKLGLSGSHRLLQFALKHRDEL